jgi:hypothetical protein
MKAIHLTPSTGKLLACSLLTGTGGGLLFSSSPARATIIYSGLSNISLTRPASQGVENTQNVSLYTGTTTRFGWLYDAGFPSKIQPSLSIGFDLASNTYLENSPNRYNPGDVPSSTSSLGGENKLYKCDYPGLTNCSSERGLWGAGGIGYVSYYQEVGSDRFYGWAQINMPTDFTDPTAQAILLDWAYQDTPNQRLAMGEGARPADVPGPLPLLGAAAAYRASRLLRKKVKGNAVANG